MLLKKTAKDKSFRKWLIRNRQELSTNYYYISTILRAYKTGEPLAVAQRTESRLKTFRRDHDNRRIYKLFRGKLLERFFDYIDEKHISVSLYRDYLTACQYLGLDMTLNKNRFPHDFMHWHDERIDEYMNDPYKFLNVTNGVTPRRWLMLCNKELADFYDESLGLKWRSDLKELREIHCTNANNLREFASIKASKKRQLAAYIENKEGIKLLPDAIYVSQVKRLHEYKRQLMTALAILYLYFDLKDGKLPDFTPMVFIFGAKAASGYKRAKAIIKFINDIAELVNGDEEVNARLQVVFVQNYGVSYAEKIIPGTDVSLQVSTAGFEASGTGNMKFMMNGAVTLGTLDGANIEIMEKAGGHSSYIFGAKVTEIEKIKASYDPGEFVARDLKIKRVTDTLTDGTFDDEGGELKEIYASLFEQTYNSPDYYLVLYDLPKYLEALLRANKDYQDEELFARKQLVNATRSAYFSSDRAIEEYAERIWKLGVSH